MIVKVSESVDVSNEQRKQLARLLDGPDAKARDATRDECRRFIWAHGAHWAGDLDELVNGPRPQGESENQRGPEPVEDDSADDIL